eukprot:GGOE01053946.1.p1 GENE.GGOE01053946.1~~GGOE01053946.1.p1  ORF type:complete len:944 (-),score=166.87 GGOE01053946.1:588-3077(-)
MNNLGNTCFMNSVLQTLTYIPPLRNFIATICKEHGQRYQDVQGFDPLNTLRRLFLDVCSGQRVISPDYVFRNLKRLAKSFRPGRQEDAQEFALYMLEACHDALLRAAGGKVDTRTAETTAIHQIFGGYLRSQVQWSKEDELRRLRTKSAGSRTEMAPSVGNTSDTYDPFLILSIEIKGDSIEKCLQHFTRPEILDSRNMYKTPSGVYVTASKRFTIFQPPRVLTLHLKRFNAMRGFVRGMDFGKINQMVAYPETLSLAPYCSKPSKGGHTYLLIGVVVHEGASVHSGHYYSYVRAANAAWYCCDDAHVRQVGLQEVLRQRAYMLVYIRKDRPPSDPQKLSQPSPVLKPKVSPALQSTSAIKPVPTSAVAPVTGDASRAVSPSSSSSASSTSISTADSRSGPLGGKKRKRQVESCDVLRRVDPFSTASPSDAAAAPRLDAAMKDVAHIDKKRRDRERQADLSKRLHSKVFQHANADHPAPDSVRRLLIAKPSPSAPALPATGSTPPSVGQHPPVVAEGKAPSNHANAADVPPRELPLNDATGDEERRKKTPRRRRRRRPQELPPPSPLQRSTPSDVKPESGKESSSSPSAKAGTDMPGPAKAGDGDATVQLLQTAAKRHKKRKRSHTPDVPPPTQAAVGRAEPACPSPQPALKFAAPHDASPELLGSETPRRTESKVLQAMDMKSLSKVLGDVEPRELWDLEAAKQASASRKATVAQLDRRPNERPQQDKEWDEAYDCGRQRKVKMPRFLSSEGGANPFQQAAEQKGKLKSSPQNHNGNWHQSQRSRHEDPRQSRRPGKFPNWKKNGAAHHAQGSNGFQPGHKWVKRAYQ